LAKARRGFAMTVAHRQLIPPGPDRRCRLQLHC
jgi:hypothetical protein